MNVFNLGRLRITAAQLELENTISSHYVAIIEHRDTNMHFVVESFGRELSRITHFDNLIDGTEYYNHVYSKAINEGWKNVETLLDDERINVQGFYDSFSKFSEMLRLFLHKPEEIDTLREYIVEVVNKAYENRLPFQTESKYGEQWEQWA